MSDSEQTIESPEPSQEPSPQRRVSLQEVKATQDMLIGFREGIMEASIIGKYSKTVAMGIEFLNNMIEQSRRDVERVKIQEKSMMKNAKDAIKEAGGKFNAEVIPNGPTADSQPAS
jgi:hypothetical protein